MHTGSGFNLKHILQRPVIFKYNVIPHGQTDILSFPHHGLSNPFAVTEQVYKLVNPHLILVPGGERGVVRKFALHQAYAQTNPVILCSRDGNILVSTDGTDIWYAVQVEPGTVPLGEKLPPRENVR